jgi:hypothetical protein
MLRGLKQLNVSRNRGQMTMVHKTIMAALFLIALPVMAYAQAQAPAAADSPEQVLQRDLQAMGSTLQLVGTGWGHLMASLTAYDNAMRAETAATDARWAVWFRAWCGPNPGCGKVPAASSAAKPTK